MPSCGNLFATQEHTDRLTIIIRETSFGSYFIPLMVLELYHKVTVQETSSGMVTPYDRIVLIFR